MLKLQFIFKTPLNKFFFQINQYFLILLFNVKLDTRTWNGLMNLVVYIIIWKLSLFYFWSIADEFLLMILLIVLQNQNLLKNGFFFLIYLNTIFTAWLFLYEIFIRTAKIISIKIRRSLLIIILFSAYFINHLFLLGYFFLYLIFKIKKTRDLNNWLQTLN